MTTLTIKNIPEHLYKTLKKIASESHRSLNSEIIHRLEQSCKNEKQIDTKAFLAKIHKIRAKTKDFQLTQAIIDKAIDQGQP